MACEICFSPDHSIENCEFLVNDHRAKAVELEVENARLRNGLRQIAEGLPIPGQVRRFAHKVLNP